MKKAGYIFLFLSLPQILFSQNAVQYGQILESLSFESNILNQKVNYSVYLPPDYHYSKRSYPVLFLLHGYSDNETAWVQFGQVNTAADKGIRQGAVPSMIIVMPDAGVSWYINDYKNELRYEDMFIKEFVPYIDKTYRTRQDREFRAISGLSMGGYGSLMYSMRYPELFSVCVAFSASVLTDEDFIQSQRYNRLLSEVVDTTITGKKRLTTHWNEHNPLYLAKKLPVSSLQSVKWYIDCGDDDFLYRGNAHLHIILRQREVPHEYRVRNGGHEWRYWRTGIIDGLRFIGQAFHR